MNALRVLFVGLYLTAAARAQHTPMIDLLSPGEPGYEDLPAGVAVVDYFVDVAPTDVWTAAGTRVQTQNGATLIYADNDLNTPGVQIGLINPGLDQRYTTFLSRPRDRDASVRFTNAGAQAAGDWGSGPAPIAQPTLVSVGWFRSPPATPSTPSEDGYVFRVAIDLGDFADRRELLQLSLTPPDPGLPRLAWSTHPVFEFGWANATFDVPAFHGLNWYLFDPVPEPTSGAAVLLPLAIFARAFRRR